MKKFLLLVIPSFSILFSGCTESNIQAMTKPVFIEIEVQNHLVSHGFDEENKEVIEEVQVETPMKKLIRIDRIQSISEKYILTTYGYGRLVYWEYTGSYEAMKKLMVSNINEE